MAARAEAYRHGIMHVDEEISAEMLNFLDHGVDPKRSKPSLRPASGGAYAGMHELVPMKAITSLVVGTGGWGYALIDPDSCAACADRAIGLTTTASAVSNSGSTIGIAPAAGAYVSFYPSRTGHTGAGFGAANVDGDFFQSFVSACAVYVKPVGSATTQNGMMYLLESPGHPAGGAAGPTINEVISHPRTRSITGAQIGDPSFDNVLNYHYQERVSATGALVSEYNSPTAATTNANFRSLIVVVQGDPGTEYNLEVYGSWGARGNSTNPTKFRWIDTLGMQSFYNLAAAKRISGWVGNDPAIVREAYRLGLGRAARRVKSKALNSEQEARAALDRSKATRPSSSWFIDLVKEATPLLKDVAGLFF